MLVCTTFCLLVLIIILTFGATEICSHLVAHYKLHILLPLCRAALRRQFEQLVLFTSTGFLIHVGYDMDMEIGIMSRLLVGRPTFDDWGTTWSDLFFLPSVISCLNSKDWRWPTRNRESKRYDGGKGCFDMGAGRNIYEEASTWINETFFSRSMLGDLYML